MAMATFTDDHVVLKKEFQAAHSLFSEIKEKYNSILPEFDVLSMGMSGDYKLAIENGSNMVRVGSLVFGAR